VKTRMSDVDVGCHIRIHIHIHIRVFTIANVCSQLISG
jgi:hypothetical protein